jgi:putative ABC transport system permease protein
MIGALGLALRAIWWRKGASAVVLVVAVFATGMAASGPLFLQGAGESILQDALVSGAATSAGTGAEITRDATGKAGKAALKSDVAQAMRGLSLARQYRRDVMSLELKTRVLDPHGAPLGRVTVVARDSVCGQVRMVTGRCIAGAGADDVMVSAVDALRLKWVAGQRITVDSFRDRSGADPTTRRLLLVGTYVPVDPGGGYWFNDTRHYFGGDDRGQQQAQGQPAADRTLEAAFVGNSAFAAVTASASTQILVVEDLLLDPGSVTLADVPQLRRELDEFGVRLHAAKLNQGFFFDSVNTQVRQVLDRADTGVARVSQPIAVVQAELVLLGLFVLFLVVAAAAEARGGEVALAKVRGLPTGVTVSFGLLETVLLLVIAGPVGTGLGLALLSPAAPSVFGPRVSLHLDVQVWAAVAVTLGGGLVAAVLASVGTLRQPVVDQGRRTSGRLPGRGVALEAVAVSLTAVALWELWQGNGSLPPLDNADPDVLALVAPTLLAFAGALLGARALPLLTRLVSRWTRRSRYIGLFIGTRELSRRPGGTRLLVVLTTAFALATFSVLSAQVFAANRLDRARTEIGANRVVLVDPYSTVNLRQVVDRLDPAGAEAMAVAQVPSFVFGATSADSEATSGPSRDAFSLLVVDPSRLASTAFWRSDFAAATPRSLAAALSPAFPLPLSWRGDTLRLTVSAKVACCGAVAASLEATGSEGHSFDLPLGGFRPGTGPPTLQTFSVKTPACVHGPCALRALALSRDGPGTYSVVGNVTVTAVQAGRGVTFHPVPGATDASRWQGLNAAERAALATDLPAPGGVGPLTDGQAPEQVSATTLGVRLGFVAPSLVRTFGLATRVPVAIAAVATAGLQAAPGTHGYQISLPSGTPVLVQVAATAQVLPRGGDQGVLVSWDMLAAAQSLGDDQVVANEVWLDARAPADFPARLARAGVTVTGVESVGQRSQALARQGPALAVRFLLAGALAAAALSVGATVVNISLVARRRAFELAALRALGFRPRTVLAAAVTEPAILAGFAVCFGVGLGVLGARLGLPTIPEFADGATVPALLIHLDPRTVLLVAVALAGILGAGIATSAALLVSSAGPDRLREGQA